MVWDQHSPGSRPALAGANEMTIRQKRDSSVTNAPGQQGLPNTPGRERRRPLAIFRVRSPAWLPSSARTCRAQRSWPLLASSKPMRQPSDSCATGLPRRADAASAGSPMPRWPCSTRCQGRGSRSAVRPVRRSHGPCGSCVFRATVLVGGRTASRLRASSAQTRVAGPHGNEALPSVDAVAYLFVMNRQGRHPSRAAKC